MIWHALVFRAVQRARRPSAPCPRCGRTVEAGRLTCPACAAVLPPPPPVPASRADRWAAGAVVLLLLAALVYLVVTHDPSPPPAGAPATERTP